MAKKNSGGRSMGAWAFLIGVILALIFGFMGELSSTLVWILVIIGLIVGFMNVSEREVSSFLMSGAVLIIASAFGGNSLSVIPAADRIVGALMVIFVPAVIVVAVKHVFVMAKD
jgi:uncharacterized membrane protein